MSRARQHHPQRVNPACAAQRAADELLIRAIFGEAFCEDAAALPVTPAAPMDGGAPRDAQTGQGESALRAAA